MADENNIFENEVLSSTLNNVFIGLSGLYDAALNQKTKLSQQITDRTSADSAITGDISGVKERVTALETSVGESGNIGSRVSSLETNLSTLSTAVEANETDIEQKMSDETSARISGDQTTLASAKQYVDDALTAYTTSVDLAGQINDTKQYAQTTAEAALTSGKAYTDQQIAGALTTAQGYADTASGAAVASSKAYVDEKVIEVKGYTDTASGNVLAAAKEYTDAASAALAAIDTTLTTKLGNITLQKVADNAVASGNAAEYVLIGPDGTAVGSPIAIAKDQFLKSAQIVEGTNGTASDKLQLVFVTTEGEKTVDIALSGLFNEYSAESGVALNGTVFSGVVDPTSESFLSVGEDGFKLSGVQTAISTAVAAETSARTEAIEDINEQISAINAQLGLGDGNADGASLTDRVVALEEALPVEAVSGGAILVQMGPSGNVLPGSGNWKLNPIYNAGINLAFNNKIIEYGATKITFAGTVTTTKTADGEVKVQIGENMNSSSWNTSDGKTNGSVTDVTTDIALLNGLSGYVTKTQTATFKSTGYTHFDQGDNLWTVIITAAGTQIVNATLTDTLVCADDGTPTWTATAITGTGAVSAVTTSITGKAREDNYPSSVGGRAQRSFTIDFAKLGDVASKALKISIQGCGGKFNSKTFYYITGATPAVAENPTLTVENGVSVYYSGVEYYGTGTTFTFETGNISNLNNQVEVNTSTVKLDFSSTNCAAPSNIKGGNYASGLSGATSAQDNVATSYKATGLAVSTNKNVTSVSVSVTPKNYFATGTARTATLTTDKPINTYTTASTDTVENCQSEGYRVINSSVVNNSTDRTKIKFNSQSALADDELQLVPGDGIQYPAGKTGTRYFTRRFIKAGSLTGSTITFTFGSGDLSKVIVQIMKGENVWTPINKFNGTYSYATAASTSSKLVLSFGDGNANGGYWFRVGMTQGTTAKITKIEMA